MKRWRRIAVAAVVLLAAGWYSLRAVGHDETEWVRVERDDLVLGVEVSGTLKSVVTDLVGPPQLRNTWNFKIAYMAPEGEEVHRVLPSEIDYLQLAQEKVGG